jgi:hypothetical protein
VIYTRPSERLSGHMTGRGSLPHPFERRVYDSVSADVVRAREWNTPRLATRLDCPSRVVRRALRGICVGMHKRQPACDDPFNLTDL